MGNNTGKLEEPVSVTDSEKFFQAIQDGLMYLSIAYKSNSSTLYYSEELLI